MNPMWFTVSGNKFFCVCLDEKPFISNMTDVTGRYAVVLHRRNYVS